MGLNTDRLGITMHVHTSSTRQPLQAPSQSMRGVALPCAAETSLALWRGAEEGVAYSCGDTRIGSRDFGNSVGGAPA
jgi:hypothetical protein